MITRKITVLLAAAALMLAACKGKDEPAATVTQAPANPLLSHVPADTPYLFANLEPTPAAVVDAYLGRFAPTLDMVQSMLDDLSIKIHSDGNDGLGDAALFAALLQELDGKLNRAGLESLGLSLESHKAFYGMGVFPVARIALKDANALRVAIGRIETSAGRDFPEQKSGDASYWRITDENEKIGLYIAILSDHLALGVFPAAVEVEYLPALLGQAPASAFDANGALAQLNRDKGFLAYGSGWLDFKRMGAELMNVESSSRHAIEAAGEVDLPSLDAVCVSEINGLIDHAPRLVLGTTELDANAIGMRYQLEMDATLAGQLAHLVSDVPPASTDAGLLLSASLALQAGRLREFLLERATARVNEPFQCDQLAHFNQLAHQGLAQMNQPMPPFLGNINGMRVNLDSIDFSNPDPKNVRGLVVFEVEKPQMLVGMASMLVPGLDELNIEPGAGPVDVPEELMSLAVDGMHVSAVMSQDALGVSLGEGQKEGLLAFLEADDDNQGTWLSVDYDMASYLKFQQIMREREMSAHADDESAETQKAMAMLREVEQSYADSVGRTRMELRFTPQGFEVHTRMTFN